MIRRFAFAAILPLAAASIVMPAVAQELAAPALKVPKASGKSVSTKAASAAKAERRPGELEGGFNSGVTAPLAKKKVLPADVVSEKRLPDGGLPLPSERSERGYGDAPMGFDKNGNIGGMFKF